MPGPKTHQIFYKQLKTYLKQETQHAFPNYDSYSIFAQGHDLLIYHNFYKIFNNKCLERNVALSKQLQEYFFPEFVYRYLAYAEQMELLDNQQIRLFIGTGYIAHHILDAYTHPLIIYYAGDHTRDTGNRTWMHGIAENLIDIYLMEQIEKIQPKKYPVYKDFDFKQSLLDERVCAVLDRSLEETYDFKNGGGVFREAFMQVKLFMRMFKYDPVGVKQKLFDFADPLLKGTSSFSYHRSCEGVQAFLNEEHEIWCNPMNADIQSQESFMDLYNKALRDSAKIIEQLEILCRTGKIHRDDVYNIVPDVASTHGLKCGQEIEIKYTSKR